MTIHRLCLFFLCSFFTSGIYAQGCSDAGFCTMGAMKPNQHYQKNNKVRIRSVEVSQYFGYTKFGDVLISYIADLNFQVSKKWTVQLKLPYSFVSGPLARTNGAGDVSYSITRNVIKSEKLELNATLGGKLPTNNSDKTNADGRPLPMYYQTSLGTYDFIAGLSLVSRHWLFATGYQMPFNQNNNNFLWGAWTTSDKSTTALDYPRAKELKRGNDVMFRAERNFRSSRWNGHLGLLAIYRLNKDEITLQGKRVLADGSDGLVLNGIGGVGYHFNVRSSLKLLMGVKIINREENPDGLSREFVNTISYEYIF